MYYILNRYIRKVIISSIIIVFAILISLSSIIRLIDELRKMGKYSYPFYEFLVYCILNIPKDFELFFPIATFLGGLLGLGIIEIHNEFVVMQVSGISKLQITTAVIKASIPVLFCSMIANEWIVPGSERILCIYKNYMHSDIDIIKQNKLGNLLWFVDNNCFFCIDRILTYNELLGLTLYNFDEHKKLKKIIFVKRALYINKIWNFIDIDELDFSTTRYVDKKRIPCITWNFVLTPYILSILTENPRILSISSLYYCIQYLNQVGQNSKYYQLIFWNKVIFPCFSGLVMMVMAISCTFGPLYRKKISMRLFVGALVGFVFYILNQIFGTLSIVYAIPAIFGSILPTIIFLIISIIIIWKYY